MSRSFKEQVEGFMKVFRGRTDWYGHRAFDTNNAWYEGERDEHGKLVYKRIVDQIEVRCDRDDDGANLQLPAPLTAEKFEDHLNHKQGLALIPVVPPDTCYFAVIDIDKDDIDHQLLAKRIKSFGLPLWQFISRHGAAHLILILDGDGKPAGVVTKRMEQWAMALGCGHDLPAAEIFPKQNEVDDGNRGNHVTLPLFNTIVDPDNRLGKFVDENGELHGIDGFLDRVKPWPSKVQLPMAVKTGPFQDGPPCLEVLHEVGFKTGTRNNGLLATGLFFKKAYPEDWKERLVAYNQTLPDPLVLKEVRNIIGSINKKGYNYACSQAPIVDYCNKVVCKTRRYGIKTAEEIMADMAARIPLPIEGLQRIETEPTCWGIKIEGSIIKVENAELLSWAKLRPILLGYMTTVPPSMKQEMWEVKLADLRLTEEKIQIPADASDYIMILKCIEDFCRHGRTEQEGYSSDAYLIEDLEKGGSWVHLKASVIRDLLQTFQFKVEWRHIPVLLIQTCWENQPMFINGKSERPWKKFIYGLHPQSAEDKLQQTLKEQANDANKHPAEQTDGPGANSI